jgi:hypothetical protein
MAIPLAVLALAAPLPAAAQTGVFPEWMIGKWCGLFNQYDYCLTFERGTGEDIVMRYTRQEGPGAAIEQVSLANITVEDGRLTVRNTQAGTILREAPHGPDEMVFENGIPGEVTQGAALRSRYTREWDQLTIQFTFADGSTVSQSYGLTHPAPAEKK